MNESTRDITPDVIPESTPPHDTLRRDLRACTGDGATYCLMVGASEGYFSALVLALGKSNILGGLSATIPMLIGSLVQLASPAGLRRLGSPRRWVQGCATVQSIALFTLATGAWMGSMPTWLIFASIAVYWSCALGAGPAWSTWVARLFPERIRARYFASRSRLCNVLQLASMLIAGWILSLGERGSWPLLAFAVIMASAAMCRLSSIPYLQRQGDVRLTPADIQPVDWQSLPRRLFKGDLRLLLFLACLQGALQTGGPFITPWLIDSLHMDKWRFTMCMAMIFVSKSLALPLVGRLIRRMGPYRVLTIGTLGTAVAIAMLPFDTSLGWILFVQATFGVSIAGVELAGFLLQLETLGHRERTSLMSMYWAMNSSATAVGSLLGAGMLKALGDWPHAYATVFIASAVLRGVVLMLRPARPRVQAVTVS